MDALGEGFILDLAHRRLCGLALASLGSFRQWQPFARVNGSPVLEGLEGTTKIRLLLDTGSSGFTLLSTPRLSSIVRDAKVLRSIQVPSFGRMLTVGELRTAKALVMLGQPVKLTAVYSLDDHDVEEMLRGAGLNGLIGLRPFVGGAIAFNVPNKRTAFGQLQRPLVH